MRGVSVGGSHALQQWQTVINTQTEWYKLHTAVGINSTSLPVDPCLVSSRRYPPAEECNRTNKSRGRDRKWMGIDRTRPWVCAWSWRWRIQAGRWCVVVPFLLTFVVFCSECVCSKTCNPPFYTGLLGSYREVTDLLQSDWETGRVTVKNRHKSRWLRIW